MKTLTKFALLATPALLVFITDLQIQPARLLPDFQWMSEAEAQYRRAARTRRRGVAVGYAAGQEAAEDNYEDASASSQQADVAAQQAATAEQQAAVAQQQAAVAQQQAAVSAAAAGPLPLGSVSPALPAGCTPVTAGGVEYQQCGSNYYRAVFQGNSLVYVTVDPNQPQ